MHDKNGKWQNIFSEKLDKSLEEAIRKLLKL